MGILRNIFYIFFVCLLTGCYETFTPHIDVTPVLCLNALVTAGEPIDVKVTHTWLYTDMENWQDHSVDDAVITIYANDNEVEADYLPEEGDRIRILAQSKKYGSAEAEVTVPYSSPIKNIDWTIDLISHSKGDNEEFEMDDFFYFNLVVKVEFSDITENIDYYHISAANFSNGDLSNEIVMSEDMGEAGAESEDGFSSFYGGYLNCDSDPLFYDSVDEMESIYGATDGFDFFTDRLFSGSSYTLNLLFVNCRYSVTSKEWDASLLDCGKEIMLHTVSKSYYDWAFYSEQIDSGVMGDISDWGFIDPVWAYSNVSTGAGVVAARSLSICKVSLKDYLEKFLKENKNNVP